MHKTLLFFYNFPFFILFIQLLDIIGIKPAPGDHESNFKEVGAIPCGYNTKRTKFNKSTQSKQNENIIVKSI